MFQELASTFQQVDWMAKAELAFYVLLYLIGAWIVSMLVRRGVRRMIDGLKDRTERREQGDRYETLGQLIHGASIAVIWVIAGMLALQQIGVNIGPVLAAAGIGGVALGFGAQTLVKDVISGAFVLFENQFHVGDVITAGGHTGAVEAVNLRLIRLRNFEGKVFFVRHSDAGIIVNHTHRFARVVLNFGVDYNEKLPRVKQMIEAVLAEMEEDPELGQHIEETGVHGVDELGDSSVNLLVSLKVKPGQQFTLRRELAGRLKVAADLTGISMPYPHRVSVPADSLPEAQVEPIDEDELRARLKEEWEDMEPGEEPEEPISEEDTDPDK